MDAMSLSDFLRDEPEFAYRFLVTLVELMHIDPETAVAMWRVLDA
jgi:hypothetical protein